MEDEQDAELRNPFPSPPSHYVNFTAHNLKLLSFLKDRAEGQEIETTTQKEILSDQSDVPDWPLTSLEKPRVDWIKEDGYYTIYGDTWFVRHPRSSFLQMVYDSAMISSKRRFPLLERLADTNCIPRTQQQ